MDFSLEKFFLNVIRIACYIVLVISALSQLGISTTGLIACFSAAAAAIALALKDSLSNIASGIILLFSKPFVTGDFIEFDSDMGEVQQIDLIHTKVRTYDYKSIVIPNSVISNMEIINYSKLPYRRIDVTVPVGYDVDIDKVKSVLLTALKTHNKILNEPSEPFVRVNEFGESSVDFIVKVWVNMEDYWDVYYDLMELIKKSLDKANIPIPFNQLDVHIN
jgi:small conductance mechanosensitive channel